MGEHPFLVSSYNNFSTTIIKNFYRIIKWPKLIFSVYVWLVKRYNIEDKWSKVNLGIIQKIAQFSAKANSKIVEKLWGDSFLLSNTKYATCFSYDLIAAKVNIYTCVEISVWSVVVPDIKLWTAWTFLYQFWKLLTHLFLDVIAIPFFSYISSQSTVIFNSIVTASVNSKCSSIRFLLEGLLKGYCCNWLG